MKISTRLWLPTLAIAGLLSITASAIWLRTAGQVQLADARLSDQESKLGDVGQWQAETSANVVRVVASVMASDPTVGAAMKADIDAAMARVTEIQRRVEAGATDPEEKALLAKVKDARLTYVAARTDAVQLHSAGKFDEARTVLAGRVKPAVAAYLASQTAYMEHQKARGAAVRADLAHDRMRTVWVGLGVLALIMAGMALGTAALVRSVARPMRELVQIAGRVGQGDLGVEIDTRRGDEIGDVMKSLAQMRDALRGIVGQVREAAESIQVASAEVASGNTDLSQRTEQAASNLQQTASSVEQLTSHVRQSADAAAQANQLASSASAVALRGGAVVAQVVTTMNEINSSSKRISDIVGTIDGIAFQTNILALNAAVEAARAGEQGRGFAVVAGEVRSLAQRSAEAAREIKALIGSSVQRVETGARLVHDAGSTMGEIVASVQRVSDIIGEITAASGEQSQGIVQVNGAISNLDQMTQQNTALVEESAAAAQSLREQAHKLSQSMKVFRLSGDGADRSGGAYSAAAAASPRTNTPQAATLQRPAAPAQRPGRQANPPLKRPASTATPRNPAVPVVASLSGGASGGASGSTSGSASGSPVSSPKPTAPAPAPVAATAGNDDWETF